MAVELYNFQTTSPSKRKINQLAGFHVCLYRDVDLDYGHHRFYGRNGIHVSLRWPFYIMGSTTKLMISIGHQLLVVNIIGTLPRDISCSAVTRFRQGLGVRAA